MSLRPVHLPTQILRLLQHDSQYTRWGNASTQPKFSGVFVSFITVMWQDAGAGKCARICTNYKVLKYTGHQLCTFSRQELKDCFIKSHRQISGRLKITALSCSMPLLCQLRKHLPDVPPGLSDDGDPSTEAPSSQVYQVDNQDLPQDKSMVIPMQVFTESFLCM